jgi:hypothetical protein
MTTPGRVRGVLVVAGALIMGLPAVAVAWVLWRLGESYEHLP